MQAAAFWYSAIFSAFRKRIKRRQISKGAARFLGKGQSGGRPAALRAADEWHARPVWPCFVPVWTQLKRTLPREKKFPPKPAFERLVSIDLAGINMVH